MLTLSQNKALQFIQSYFKKHGYSPTMAEIAKGIGIKSRGVVHRYVSALVDEGLVQLESGRRRNIKLRQNTSTLALVGCIAAGKPIEAIAEHETLDIVNLFIGPNRYALKVKGDSMIDEGIFDGDVVVCEYAEVAQNGKIVVALIDNQEATLKRIKYNVDDTVTLIPANSRHKIMTFTKERVAIQGIYIGLFRFEAGINVW